MLSAHPYRRSRTPPFVAAAVVAAFAAGLLGGFGQGGSAVAATTTYSGTTGAFTIAPGETALLINGAEITGNVLNNGTLEFGLTTSSTVSNLVSGSGNVLLTGVGGVITFSGSNSYLGGTTVRYGDLVITSGGVIYHPLADLTVGLNSGDNGFFTVAGGSVTNRDGDLGRLAGSTGTVLVTSGTWANTDLNVGYFGTGVLTISGGSVTAAGTAILGRDTGSSGDLTITGGTLNVGGEVQIGYGGTGMMLVNGGEVFSQNGSIGVTSASSGTATVSSGTWTIGGNLLVGFQGGAGTLNISSGGVVAVGDTLSSGTDGGIINLDAGGTLIIGNSGTTGTLATSLVNDGTLIFDRSDLSEYTFQISGTGAVIKRGAGLLRLTGSNSYADGTTILGGAIEVSGGWIDHAAAALDIGSSTGDVGGLDVKFGGNVVSSELNLYNGSFSMSDGMVTTGTGKIGTSGSGTASISGGTWSILDQLFVGNTGTGTMNVTGGTVVSTDAVIGTLLGDVGTVTVSDSGIWNSYGNLAVGGGGTGSLTIQNGGQVLVTGTLSKGAGSAINLNAGGTLRIGDGGTTGTLATDLSNNGLLVFNRSNDATYASSISGTGAVTKLGAGALTFSGSSSYTGATTIDAGSFYIDGQLGATSVWVKNDALLGGNGSVLGTVTVGDGSGVAVISPGSLSGTFGTLSVGSLELASNALTMLSISGTDAGVNYDQIAGIGDSRSITYGGDMEITLSGSYADNTTFHLFTNFTRAGESNFDSITLNAAGTPYEGLTFAQDPLDSRIWLTAWTQPPSGGQRLLFSVVTGDLIVVPEPSTLVMGAAGLGFVGLLRWRRRRQRAAAMASDQV